MSLRKLKHKLTELIFYSKKPHHGLIEDIRQVAIERIWKIKTIHDPFLVDVPVPGGLEDESKLTYYKNSASMGFAAQYLICIPNGINFSGGFVSLEDGRFLTESTREINLFLGSGAYRSRRRKTSIKVSGDCHCLRSCWGNEYAHWMCEDLPRLSNALPSLPEKTKFIVPENIAKWRIESLEAIGIDHERIKLVPGHITIQCERLWFATELGSTKYQHTSPQVAQRVRQKFLDYAARQITEENHAGLPSSDYIFISRQGAPCKRLMNEADLENVLHKLGFEIVRMENYSLVQQIEMIKKAKVVVGAHGAGLGNIMFAEPNTILVELQDDSYACPRPWYWKFANCYGCEYKTIVGETTKVDLFEKIEFRLNPDFLEMALADICQSNSEPETDARDWYDVAWFESQIKTIS